MTDRIPPSFEAHTSPLTRSNDGLLQVDLNRERKHQGDPAWLVTDLTDAHVETATTERTTADAFVAGYDYRERLDRAVAASVEAEARADAERVERHVTGSVQDVVAALCVLVLDPAIRRHIDPKALSQARTALGLEG